jgi:hypothetical protein
MANLTGRVTWSGRDTTMNSHHRRRAGFCGMLLLPRITQLPHRMILDRIK